MLDWLIIGGGIHGVHAAVRLAVQAAGASFRIVDDAASLLERWRTCTHNVGMTHLRSPSVHHLDVDPHALRHFAGRSKRFDRTSFAPPYDRPSLELFQQHTEHVVERLALARGHVRARVVDLALEADRVIALLDTGDCLEARHALLAIGAPDCAWPSWSRTFRREQPERIAHVFDPGFDPSTVEEGTRVAVIGGGNSAGQLATLLEGKGTVHLVARHEPAVQMFDADPGWMGPKYLSRFESLQDPRQKRGLIDRARHRGTMPPEVARSLRFALRRGNVQWHVGEVEDVRVREGGISLSLKQGGTIEVDRIVLATGFRRLRPGGAWIDRLIERENLPCSPCGFPIVNRHLRWHPRLFVAGALAELELGPAARNISGARRAGERLIDFCRRVA